MSCVLRIGGSKEAIQRFIERNFIVPVAVFEEGINVLVSDADFDKFDEQIENAVSFLERDGEQLYEICQSFGIENWCLDFGLAQTDNYVQGFYFPANLLFLTGNYGIDIEVSLYPLSNDATQTD